MPYPEFQRGINYPTRNAGPEAPVSSERSGPFATETAFHSKDGLAIRRHLARAIGRARSNLQTLIDDTRERRGQPIREGRCEPFLEQLITHDRLSPEFLLDSPEQVSWWNVSAIIQTAGVRMVDILVGPEEYRLGSVEHEATLRRRMKILAHWCRQERPPQI